MSITEYNIDYYDTLSLNDTDIINNSSSSNLKDLGIKFIFLLMFQIIVVLCFTFSGFVLLYQTWFKQLECYLSFVISIICSLVLYIIFCCIQNYILYLIIGTFNFIIWFIIMILIIKNKKKDTAKISNNDKIYQNLILT
jgi:hypothetical protein